MSGREDINRLIRVSVTLLTIAAALSACQLSKLRRVRVEASKVCVSVRTVSRGSDISRRCYAGTCEPSKTAVVNAPHTGILVALNVSLSRTVEAGSLMAEIRSQTLTSSYKASELSVEQARDALSRAEKVYDSGSVSELKMVDLRTQAMQAEAAFAAAANALEECKVRAPFRGKVTEVYVHKGERVTVGEPIIAIIDENALQLEIPVPEKEIASIVSGDRAQVIVPALGEEMFGAVVTARNPVANKLSHSYKCTLSLDRPVPGLMSGMACKVYMERDRSCDIVIPADVIKVDTEGKYVWIVENGIVHKRRIVPGGYSGKGVIVAEGLSEGETVIVEGAGKVSSGMEVEVR